MFYVMEETVELLQYLHQAVLRPILIPGRRVAEQTPWQAALPQAHILAPYQMRIAVPEQWW